MGVVGAAASVPATVIPRQGLICSNGAIGQLADEAVNTDLPAAGMIGVPVIVVLVLTKEAIIRTHIALQPGVVSPCAVHHDTLDRDFAACLVAGVFRENELMQIHSQHPPLR